MNTTNKEYKKHWCANFNTTGDGTGWSDTTTGGTTYDFDWTDNTNPGTITYPYYPYQPYIYPYWPYQHHHCHCPCCDCPTEKKLECCKKVLDDLKKKPVRYCVKCGSQLDYFQDQREYYCLNCHEIRKL